MKVRGERWWGLAVLATSLCGCPGELDERLFDTGVQTGACSSDDLQRMVFNASCTSSGCHDSSNQPAGGLDLLSAGAQQRLVDMPVPGGQSCSNRGYALVAPGDPAHSLLLLKVEPSPPCGARMPLGAVSGLADTQIECVRSWIASLPPPTMPFDSGVTMMDAGTDGGHPDAAPSEASTGDAVGTDVAPTDTGSPDGGGPTDATVDAGVDTGVLDTGVAVDTGTDAGSALDAGVDAAIDTGATE